MVRNRRPGSFVSEQAAGGLDAALKRAGDGGFAIRGDGRIVLWNRAAEGILGYTVREAVGRRCCDLFVGDDSGNRLCYRGCHVMELVEMRDPVHSFDMRTRTKSGCCGVGEPQHAPSLGGRGRRLTVHLLPRRDRDQGAPDAGAGAPGSSPTTPRSAGTSALTRRELEVLAWSPAGVNTRATAERLHVSPATVRNHVQNILDKLGAHSRLEAVAYATRHRLI